MAIDPAEKLRVFFRKKKSRKYKARALAGIEPASERPEPLPLDHHCKGTFFSRLYGFNNNNIGIVH